MNLAGTLGGLVPLWIIGAPILWAVYELFATPKGPFRHDGAADGDDRPQRMATPTTETRPRV